MINDDIGGEYIQHFDSLNFDQRHERRIGLFVLENFFGTILSRVGSSVFNIYNSDKLTTQWQSIRDRLKKLDGFNIPDRFEGIIFQIKNKRNSAYHDFEQGVDKHFLENVRGSTLDWRNWLLSHAKKYYDVYGRYARQEIRNTQEFVEDVMDLEQYSRAVEYLVNEIDYALRILLKSEGVRPQLRNKLEWYLTDVDNVYFDRPCRKTYRRLSRVRSGIIAGKKIGEREANWHTTEGIELLRYIHNFLSPFGENSIT